MTAVKKHLKTVWNGNAKGYGSITANNLEIKIALSEASGGSGEGVGPKELLVSTTAACFMMTLVRHLETTNLPVDQLTMNSEATISKEEGFKIIHYPHIILSANATEEQIQITNKAIESAEEESGIGKMLKKADVQIDIAGKVSVPQES